MDAAYFGKERGIMVLCDSITKQALLVEAVRQESNTLYLEALHGIRKKAQPNKVLPAMSVKDWTNGCPTFPCSHASFSKCKSSTVIRPDTRKALLRVS